MTLYLLAFTGGGFHERVQFVMSDFACIFCKKSRNIFSASLLRSNSEYYTKCAVLALVRYLGWLIRKKAKYMYMYM